MGLGWLRWLSWLKVLSLLGLLSHGSRGSGRQGPDPPEPRHVFLAWLLAPSLCVTLALPLQGLRPENQTSFHIMPRAVSSRTSTLRRHRQADKILSIGVFAMRSCAHCVSSNSLCILSDISEKCEQCHRFNRPCDLAAPWAEVDRLLERRDKLREERLAAEAKAIRLRKQERQILKKVRALGSREEQNIQEMEEDEASGIASGDAATRAQSPSRGPTSPTGLSQVSFGSFGRTSPVPSGN